MKKATGLLIILLLAPAYLQAEVVFTNDGKVHRGKIVEEAKEGMTFRTYAGAALFFPADTILRSVYTEMYLGKQVVKKTNGEELEVFIVAEDRDFFIYRYKLESPDEHKAARKDVMFITRKDPTGLEGKPALTSAALTWNPPYGGAKKYRVYYREAGKVRNDAVQTSDWTMAAETSSAGYTVTGLESRKKYIFMVTALDKSGDESNPSNEAELTTANYPPDNPSRPGAVKKISDGKMSVDLSWEKAVDPDGEIKNYTVYLIKDDKPVSVAETAETAYTIQNLDPVKIHQFRVVASDTDGSESKPGLYIDTRYRGAMEAAVSARAVLPLGAFADLTGPGGGLSAAYYFNDVYTYNLRLGVSAGYTMYSPADSSTESAYFLYGSFQAAWKFYLSDNYYIAPAVSAGFARTGIEYTQAYLDTFVKKPETSGRAPLASAGAEFGFEFLEQQTVTVFIDYTALIEKKIMHSITAGIGYGYKI